MGFDGVRWFEDLAAPRGHNSVESDRQSNPAEVVSGVCGGVRMPGARWSVQSESLQLSQRGIPPEVVPGACVGVFTLGAPWYVQSESLQIHVLVRAVRAAKTRDCRPGRSACE